MGRKKEKSESSNYRIDDRKIEKKKREETLKVENTDRKRRKKMVLVNANWREKI